MAQVFFSYSHKDEDFRNELETHLAMLRREGKITAWHDRRITAGSDIHDSISEELESAQIILLLVSANFLASDYCFEREMARAMEKHQDGSAVVIPVILHPCDWHSAPFGSLRATPTDGKPVSMHANQHEAFAIIAADVRQVAERFAAAEGCKGTDQPARPSPAPVTAGPRSSNLRIKRQFDDHERDEFLEDSYEYIARYFAGSLDELSARNPQIKTRFKRTSATSFAASIYEDGQRVAQCAVWYGGSTFVGEGIAYSVSGEAERNSYNELLSIEDDGYTLQLKPFGMPLWVERKDGALTQQGAAEYYWDLLIRPLQQ